MKGRDSNHLTHSKDDSESIKHGDLLLRSNQSQELLNGSKDFNMTQTRNHENFIVKNEGIKNQIEYKFNVNAKASPKKSITSILEKTLIE